ncbi:hypothetical protein EDEG_00502 [Edhazardia aedis USNM 41457]|uniref:EF-hand domain-containing protein n=1 Tax=Edhazardia aedis (strain USNM 41457) TaxID=1003232 RepID=J9DIW0_EDHAE|nr:hypothetical protein EDEG_00502 [Edhazardia aedis USNM 41457]|eukprot:EJW01317.1 hypothetical protein EDEG_00502 [Edhazardia aedis USNM 41457]
METDTFDWYTDANEYENVEYKPEIIKKSLTEKFYDFMLYFCNYIATFAGIAVLFRYIFFFKRTEIDGISLDTILLCIVIHLGSLSLITYVIVFVSFLTRRLASEKFQKTMSGAYRWLALSLWYLINLYMVGLIEKDIKHYYLVTVAYLQSGLLGSITFTSVNIMLEYFCEYFIAKSLFTKMKDVNSREMILNRLKNFCFDLTEDGSTQTIENDCTFLGLFNFKKDINNSRSLIEEEIIDLRKAEDTAPGDVYFRKPQLESVAEAKSLAKDIFYKVTDGEERMSFDSFARIFPSTQIAIQSFMYFDTDDDRKITKKDFRDTIIQFYVDRINLEKNFITAKGFVDILGDCLRIVVFIFLIFAWLIIFGVPLKELLALVLSSALMLNFAASGIAVDLYYNLMMLLSHPFDVGDDIIIDNIEYKVFQIGLTSSSFLTKHGGKIKILNSVLWKKTLVNMSRAPEKILAFEFSLPSDINPVKLNIFKSKIHQFLKSRPYDFYEIFSLESNSETHINIDKLECALILRGKSYKTKAKKFTLRVDVIKMLNEVIDDLNISAKRLS